MSTVIHLVLCLNFLVILPLQLIHSATIKELQDLDEGTTISKYRRARALNWKQCSWTSLKSNVDDGKICECSFDKDWKATHLHVVFNGNMQVLTESACNRWFFTFNGAECSTPVDTTVYSEGKLNVKTTFEGYCAKAFKGNVKVGLNVGPCDGYTGGNARTGWGSVSRITVEEVEPPKES